MTKWKLATAAGADEERQNGQTKLCGVASNPKFKLKKWEARKRASGARAKR